MAKSGQIAEGCEFFVLRLMARAYKKRQQKLVGQVLLEETSVTKTDSIRPAALSTSAARIVKDPRHSTNYTRIIFVKILQ